ncbi:MAG: adenosylcobalamin-dependent ribonucleoside-diphosphate reductase, partial [Nitrospirae bacterium]|nr:adenosylcobalamin-dependent ribonucleoside-diphosphate reductase [Nitrospirota bacterium]
MGSPKDPKLPPSTAAPSPSVDLFLSPNALEVLKRRYLAKDTLGQVVETPEAMFTRVAQTIAAVDLAHNPRLSRQEQEARYFRLMASLEFLPNSPTLMNAGTALGQLAACFVIPVGDSMREIFEAVSAMALIHQSGGGCGFSFSRLRPAGDKVRGTGGVASGPVSFMRIFDTATEVIKQGGRRRGANMGILRVDHPDILAFIRAKGEAGILTNFNLSVAVSDAFMQAVEGGKEYPLINPRTGKETGKLSSAKVWEEIARMAWQGGDPGVLFLDAINRDNPKQALGVMEATNPCGEMPLLPYESCNLGSLNLARMVREGRIDWEKLRETVCLGVQFLDNVIDANQYPLPQIEEITKANRKIGLGVMGFADLLLQLDLPYDSEEAIRVGEEVMAFIQKEAHARSIALGRERGSFPNFAQSRWAKEGYASLRHATVTT